MRIQGIIVAVIVGMIQIYSFAAPPLAPTGLMTELLAYPERTYISNRTPTFSWAVNDPDKDETQTGYQIIVASTPANINSDNGDLWSSGKVTSSMSLNVPYGGSSLASRGDCFWKVKTWDKDGNAGPYSSYQKFSFNQPAASLYGKVPKINCYLPDTQLIAPSRLVQLGTGHYFIEFPKEVYGTIALTFNSSSSGSLNVRLGEAKSGDAVNTSPGYDIYYEGNTLAYSVGNQTYQYQTHYPGSPWGQPSRQDLLFVTVPFRYAEILNCPVTLTQSQVRQVAVFYPRDTAAIKFTCNNSILNDVWDFCKHTEFASSWLGVMVDGNRERIPYEADSYINQLGYYSVNREYSYPRNSIDDLMADSTRTEIYNWEPQMVLMAWTDYMNTGNTSYLVKYYTKLKGKLTAMGPAGSDGLVPGGDLMDWPEPNIDGYDTRTVNTMPNALYYRALVCMRDIAHAVGNSADSSTYDAAIRQVYASFNTAFWNASQNCYIDAVGSTHASMQANFWALAARLVPADRAAKVIQFVKSRSPRFGTYGAQHLFDGFGAYDEGAWVLDFMSGTQSPQSWYHMMQMGCTITPESWDPSLGDGDGTPGNTSYDWNHAWSSAPVNIIPRWIMGIQPIEPGYGKITIKPQTGSLTNASFDLPTIRGGIHVDVSQSQSSYTLVTSIPANTVANVYFPKRAGVTPVFKDGVQTQGVDDGKYLRFDNTGSGSHIFSTQSITAISNLHPRISTVTRISINGNVFSVKLDGASKEAIVSLYNVQGRQVSRWEHVSLLHSVGLKDRLLADGRYIVKVAAAGCAITTQVQIIKR